MLPQSHCSAEGPGKHDELTPRAQGHSAEPRLPGSQTCSKGCLRQELRDPSGIIYLGDSCTQRQKMSSQRGTPWHKCASGMRIINTHHARWSLQRAWGGSHGSVLRMLFKPGSATKSSVISIFKIPGWVGSVGGKWTHFQSCGFMNSHCKWFWS